MEFTVLGPIGLAAGDPVEVGGPRIRRLLAALLLGTGSVVSVDRLLDIVFEGAPTPAATTTLRSYVARLRRVLRESGSGANIVRVSPGYRLDLHEATVDAHRFEGLLETGRALVHVDPENAATHLARALEVWAGPAYADFADEDWVRTEAIRLDQLRLSAEEAWFEAMIECGRHAEVVADLIRFVSEHPLRESSQRAAMIALYRHGRQAEALRQGDAYHRELASIGLEPGSAFLEYEHRIATGDPVLLQTERSRLRGYRVLEQLDTGRHGMVRAAVQPGLGREVAIRSYPPRLADDPRFLRLMEPCIRRVARLEHPHIVSIIDFWREPGGAHLVTQLLVGGNLLDEIAKGPAPAERVGEIVEGVGSALQMAHDLKAFHGALTPSDIILDEAGSPHVDDIEVGRLLDGIAESRPRPGYARRANAEPAAAADQYALAAIAFHMLTGELPLAADSSRPFPLVSEIRPELVALDGVLTRAGAIEPADRYPDVASFVRSFTASLGRTSLSEPVRPSNPYVGLRPFDEGDAARFFGRREEVNAVLSTLERVGHVCVVGASGSGKSSLVLAGVVPGIRAGRIPGSESWFITTMRPGPEPLTTLGAAIEAVVLGRQSERAHEDDGPKSETVLVIDQMEELLSEGGEERAAAFFDELWRLLEGGVRLLATIRADHYERALRHPRLSKLLVAGTSPLTGLDPGGVAAAVTGPAERFGVEIDPELVAQLVADTADRPTVLPLLQYTLTEMYSQGSGARVTLADYERIGGLAGAVAARAERIHAATPPAERPVIRDVFLRLVGRNSQDAAVRRRAKSSELDELADQTVVRSVVERFSEARLLGFDHDPVTREPTVEVAHESLLWAWPRLAAWIEEEGEGLSIRSVISSAAAAWEDAGREPGGLLRGARLATAEEWFAGDQMRALTEVERSFLQTSIEHRDRELLEQRRINARLRRRLVAIGGILTVALAAGIVAFVQGRRASDEALAATRARSLALAAASASVLDEDQSLALLLAVESQRLDRSASVMRALLGGLAGSGDLDRRVIPTDAADYTALAISADERVAAARRGNGSIDVIDLTSRAIRHAALPGPSRLFGSLDIDPSGKWVVSAGIVDRDPVALVYELETGFEVARFTPEGGAVPWAGFSPDGASLVVADDLGTVTLYDVEGWDELQHMETDLEASIPAMAFSPDSSRLYLSEWGPAEGTIGSLYALDLSTGDLVAGPVPLADDAAISMAVADDGTVIAAEEHISFHRGDTLERVEEATFQAPISYFGLASTPDGRVLAADPTELQIISFGPDGAKMRTIDTPVVGVSTLGDGFVVAQTTGSLATWTEAGGGGLGQPLEPAGPGAVTIDPTGRMLAVWGGGRGVTLFDRSTLAPVGELEMERDAWILGLDFSADASRIALLTCRAADGFECSGSVDVWATDTGRRLAGPVSVGPVVAFAISGVAFGDQDDVLVIAGTGVRALDSHTLELAAGPVMISEISPVSSDRVVVVSVGDVDGRSRIAATVDSGQTVVAEWRANDLEVIEVIEAVPAMYLDDGTLLTGIANGPFVARDPDTLDPKGPVYRAQAFPNLYRAGGPDLLVSTGAAGVELWDRDSGEAISPILPAGISAVAPDGGAVYLGAADGGDVARALSLDPVSLQERACDLAGRNLTGGEWLSLMGSEEPYWSTCPQWPDASYID